MRSVAGSGFVFQTVLRATSHRGSSSEPGVRSAERRWQQPEVRAPPGGARRQAREQAHAARAADEPDDVLRRGLTPFLHVSHENGRAKELYEQNGYRIRRDIAFWSLRRGDGDA